eukprot:scaffold281198_cov41-Prasinocladus_malaysianus.AAC.1
MPEYQPTSSPTLFGEITQAETVYDLGVLYMQRAREFKDTHMSLMLQELVRRGINFNHPDSQPLKAALGDILIQIRHFAHEMDVNKLARIISCLSTLKASSHV